MPTTRLRYTLTAGAATALLLLTGCTGDSEAGPPPLPTVSPAPTVGAFASDAPEPEPEPSPETAKQFIRRWAALSVTMQNTGQTEEFRQASSRCPNCLELADHVDEIYGSGGYIKAGAWDVTRVLVQPSPSNRVQALVWTKAGPSRFKESRRAKVQRLAGGRSRLRFELRRNDGEWILLGYSLSTVS